MNKVSQGVIGKKVISLLGHWRHAIAVDAPTLHAAQGPLCPAFLDEESTPTSPTCSPAPSPSFSPLVPQLSLHGAGRERAVAATSPSTEWLQSETKAIGSSASASSTSPPRESRWASRNRGRRPRLRRCRSAASPDDSAAVAASPTPPSSPTPSG